MLLYLESNKGLRMAEFGDWLFRKRKRAGLTQQDVAEKSGCSKSYISTLERGAVHSGSGGDIRPSEDMVAAIAAAVKAPINEARLAAGYREIVNDRKSGSVPELSYEPLTEDEKQQIISSFEGMPPAIRGSARKMIDAILETLPDDDDNLRTYGKRKE